MGHTEARAISLNVTVNDGRIEAVLTGDTETARVVSYEIVMNGNSVSRHRGSTTIPAGEPVILSRLAMSAGADWCVRADITEEGGPSYAYAEGPGCN